MNSSIGITKKISWHGSTGSKLRLKERRRKQKWYQFKQITMAQLFLQICNFIDNLLKFNQIQIYGSQVNILNTFNGLRALAP
jgi:hypothetical protein